ncbi:DUF2914 domain-containing protein [Candidatus Thioglobus sp.]|uniref:DUF2914 domain-containing protein n=1 Tax=Candidatus Thioglobus sp. TaxID=2026721 RepID=UPI003D15132A
MIKIILLFLVLTTSALANWPHENISQAVFSSSIANREPVEIITEADDSLGKIYFFTNIRNRVGDTITHRWIYTPTGTSTDKVKAEISFKVKGARWRVWSSKNIWHTWMGTWRVEVLDQHNQVLLVKTINFKKNTTQKSNKE